MFLQPAVTNLANLKQVYKFVGCVFGSLLYTTEEQCPDKFSALPFLIQLHLLQALRLKMRMMLPL